MKLHRSATTCPKSRALIASRVLDQGWSLAQAAEAADVSVLVFDDPAIASTYADLFDQVWAEGVKRAAFVKSALSNSPTSVPDVGDPWLKITFAPHSDEIANVILGGIVDRIEAETKRGRRGNVLFAVMAIDSSSPSQVWRALRDIHKDDRVFSFGVSDAPEGISLYEPKRKTGVLVTGKPVNTQLPPPFNQVPGIASGHQIHHKFVICGFNGPAPVVYCGSSNLAPGGEQKNGDNLLEIHDPNVITAFTIEALALVDHFQFLDRTAKGPQAKTAARRKPPEASRTRAAEEAGWFLSTSAGWVAKYFDPSDLRQVDRLLFGG